MMVRRAFVVLLMICLGCSAQSPPPPASSPSSSSPASDIARAVERRVRAQYSLPPDVKVIVGTLRSSEFPNYDALTVSIASRTKKQDFEFLLARDHKTLVRLTKFDHKRCGHRPVSCKC